jgi:hypothetical protein
MTKVLINRKKGIRRRVRVLIMIRPLSSIPLVKIQMSIWKTTLSSSKNKILNWNLSLKKYKDKPMNWMVKQSHLILTQINRINTLISIKSKVRIWSIKMKSLTENHLLFCYNLSHLISEAKMNSIFKIL